MAAAPPVVQAVLVTPKRTQQQLLCVRAATAVMIMAEAVEAVCHRTVLILEVATFSKVTVELQPRTDSDRRLPLLGRRLLQHRYASCLAAGRGRMSNVQVNGSGRQDGEYCGDGASVRHLRARQTLQGRCS